MTPLIKEHRRNGDEWHIYPGATPWESEFPSDRGRPLDPSVKLKFEDPRVGRTAFWGGGHMAVVRAVVLVDGIEESLLLEDWTGYPWVRVPPNALLLPIRSTE